MPFWPDRFHVPTVLSGTGEVDYPLTISSMTEWFDHRSLNSLPDGDQVSALVGRKGLYTLAQTGTARPTWAVNDGDGHGALQFDGVNDVFVASITNSDLLGGTGDFEIWTMFKMVSSGTFGWLTIDGTTNNISFYANGSYVFANVPSAAEIFFNNASVYDGNWHLMRFKKQGATRLLQIDGATIINQTTVAGTYGTGADALRLGAWNGTYTGCSYRHSLFFNAPLDAPTAAALTTYLVGAL